jgi:hypothetical protein
VVGDYNIDPRGLVGFGTGTQSEKASPDIERKVYRGSITWVDNPNVTPFEVKSFLGSKPTEPQKDITKAS